MNSFELQINRRRYRYKGPSDFSELTPRQAVGLARLRAGIHDEPGLLVPALTLLYGIRPRQLRPLMDDAWLRYHGYEGEELLTMLSQGAQLLNTIEWVGGADPKAKFIVKKFRLYDYHFGSPKILFKRLLHRRVHQGPDDALGSLSFGEFMWADAAYKKGDIPKLIAILYRPKGEAFQVATVDARAELFKQLDPHLQSTIKRHYEDALRFLALSFRNVFSGSGEEQSKKGQKGTWLDISLAMAKLDVTKIPQIESTNLYLAMKALDNQIQQAEEMEAALKSTRKR